MTLQTAYWIALGALVVLTWFRGSAAMLRTTLAILANGLVSLALARLLVWPSDSYTIGMIVVNFIAAGIVLVHPNGKTQKLVGLTFILQNGVHLAKLFTGTGADLSIYWAWLSAFAILQLVLVGGWWLYELVGRSRPVCSRDELASASHSRSRSP